MTAGDRIGWGIIGLGRIADTEIAPAVRATPNGVLAAVCSRSADRARDFAARHAAAGAHDDYRALLADPAVDAVYVATPNAVHAEQVVQAAEAGKHVLCDKPLATTVADAERAVAACQAAGVGLGVTFQTRRFEGMAEVRRLVADGALGAVRVVQVEVSSGRALPKGWRTDPALAGVGVMNNLGVHAYDLLRYLLGAEVSEATAVVDVEDGFSVDTTALALLRFDSGALAYVNAHQVAPNAQADLSVYGTEGTVLGRGVTRANREGRFTVLTPDGTRELPVSTAGGFAATVHDFAEAVLAGRAPTPSGIDALRSVELTEALARSAREGRTIRLVG